MSEMENLMRELIGHLQDSVEYHQYRILLDRVKQQPDLYERICEYHRRSLSLQLSESENFIQENNNLQKEYQDLQNNGLSNEFFAAEHQYCTMVRRLQQLFLEGANIETGL